MRIPAVLSTVHVAIAADGRLAIDVDGDPYPAAPRSGRGDLRGVLEEITAELGTAVRVEVREHDGSTYSDLATPPSAPAAKPQAGASAPVPHDLRPTFASGLAGAGFNPGEEVAVAYIVTTQTAGADGQAVVQLPPALAARSSLRMLLVGMTSAAVAEIGPQIHPGIEPR